MDSQGNCFNYKIIPDDSNQVVRIIDIRDKERKEVLSLTFEEARDLRNVVENALYFAGQA